MTDNNETFAILSLVLGIVGLLILPIIFGPLAIIFGVLGRRSEKKTIATIGLIIGVIDIVLMIMLMLWVVGVYTSSAGATQPASFSGFGQIKPVDWACDSSSGEISVVVANGAGGTINNLSVLGGSCDPSDEISAGKVSTCIIPSVQGCKGLSSGDHFQSEIKISYTSPMGLSKTSSGTVWAPAG